MQNRLDNQLIIDYLKGDEKSLEILIKQYCFQKWNHSLILALCQMNFC